MADTKQNSRSDLKENTNSILKQKSLAYHAAKPAGKIAVVSSKRCDTQEELSLAYTPGVAEPCLEIKKNISDVWKYTNRGNMVAVVTDGTAVLGLGDIGPHAGLPVMEGKAVLFKKFADVDAFPICLQNVRQGSGKGEDGENKNNGNVGHSDVDKIVEAVKQLEPNFGGVNLEDIAAPACFEIEERLKKETEIPIFHDDQHGTAIISLAALLNGLKLSGKKISEIKVVVNGAGAAGIACSKFYEYAGVKRKNIFMCDRKGLIYIGRKDDMNHYKEYFAQSPQAGEVNLAEAIKGADVFLGVSVANVVNEQMVKSMADKSVIFAMANPVPEIMPELAKKAGAFIVATGRSDYDNQVNNVLGFPGIFRGALDVRAVNITEEMKFAASTALAEIANEEVPLAIKKFLEKAYPRDAKKGLFDGKDKNNKNGGKNNPLSTEYVIPKPFDPRVVPRVARGVAQAAVKHKVARIKVNDSNDFDEYERQVFERVKLI